MSNRTSLFSQPKIRSTVGSGMKLSTHLHLPRKGPGSYRRTDAKRITSTGCVLTLNPRQPRQRDADTNSMSPPAGHLWKPELGSPLVSESPTVSPARI